MGWRGFCRWWGERSRRTGGSRRRWGIWWRGGWGWWRRVRRSGGRSRVERWGRRRTWRVTSRGSWGGGGRRWEQGEHLGRTYGALGHEVLELVERDRGLGERLVADGPAIAAEVVRAVEKEWAVTLADFLLRRSCVGL